MMDEKRKAAFFASLRKDRREQEKGYRDQALKLFPHFCERCGRSFSGSNLRELTVHHKDGNHMNNPPDGSNWALLCLYCHDDEHGTMEQRGLDGSGNKIGTPTESLGHRPFEGLRDLLVPKEADEDDPPKEDE
ncbi:MAG: HNH nuclease family protein [Candidatus Hydrogenedentes bacterium]|nr:HNH nuclease family protein [Candidatus Hydrogenedentota bacterium]